MSTFVRRTTTKRKAILSRILGAYFDLQKEYGLSYAEGAAPLLPPTINHYYGRRGKKTFLTKKATDFRDMVHLCSKQSSVNFHRTGMVQAVFAFYSPRWIKLNNEVAEMDADNRMKPMLDAIKLAYGVPDELFWSVTAVKVQSSKEATRWWIFDLGDIVEIEDP